MTIKTFFSRFIQLFNKANRLLITVVSIGVAIVILGFLVYRQRSVLLTFHWQFRPIPILLSFIIFTLTLFWAAIVWGWIMNNLGTRLSYKKHIRYFIVSNLARRIPGTVWYIANRFQLYASEGLSGKITAVASGIEMILITLAGILLLLLFSTNTIIQYRISPFFLIIIFILGVLILHPKVINWILVKRNVDITAINYKYIIMCILSYVISWVLGGIILFEIGNIITPISVGNLIYIINSWTLVGVISTIFFLAPSNFGVTEIGLSLLLSTIVPSSIAVIIAITTRILMILFEILWTSLFIWVMPDRNRLTQKD